MILLGVIEIEAEVVLQCILEATYHTHLYDTNLSCNGFSPYEIEIKLNNDIENVHRWLRANKLSLNMKKTEFMIIGSRHRLTTIENSPVLTLGGSNIKRVFQKSH